MSKKATLRDVVMGTPKGQQAAQKAMEQSIKDQNRMTKQPSKDKDLDEVLIKYSNGVLQRTGHQPNYAKEFPVLTLAEAHSTITKLIREQRADVIKSFKKVNKILDREIDKEIASAVIEFADKCIKELKMFTAGHDRAMRDEAIDIIKAKLAELQAQAKKDK